jgi:hypothetical protein
MTQCSHPTPGTTISMITADGLFGLCDPPPRSQRWGSSREDYSYWRWKGSVSFAIAMEGETGANAANGESALLEDQAAEAVQDEQQVMILRAPTVISGVCITTSTDVWRFAGFCKVLSHCGRDNSPDESSDRESMCVPSESNVSEGKEK